MPGPFELYLIRHAVAEERGEDWPDDNKRPLSDDGASRMRKAARGLDRLGITLDVIVTSPLVRTKQTAEIIANAMNPKPPIVSLESLAPGGTYQEIITDLEKQSKRTRVAIVGHEPGIGEFAARLIGSRHSIEFKKGAVCRIDVDAIPPSGPGDVRWFMTTKILRSIRK